MPGTRLAVLLVNVCHGWAGGTSQGREGEEGDPGRKLWSMVLPCPAVPREGSGVCRAPGSGPKARGKDLWRGVMERRGFPFSPSSRHPTDSHAIAFLLTHRKASRRL